MIHFHWKFVGDEQKAITTFKTEAKAIKKNASKDRKNLSPKLIER